MYRRIRKLCYNKTERLTYSSTRDFLRHYVTEPMHFLFYNDGKYKPTEHQLAVLSTIFSLYSLSSIKITTNSPHPIECTTYPNARVALSQTIYSNNTTILFPVLLGTEQVHINLRLASSFYKFHFKPPHNPLVSLLIKHRNAPNSLSLNPLDQANRTIHLSYVLVDLLWLAFREKFLRNGMKKLGVAPEEIDNKGSISDYLGNYSISVNRYNDVMNLDPSNSSRLLPRISIHYNSRFKVDKGHPQFPSPCFSIYIWRSGTPIYYRNVLVIPEVLRPFLIQARIHPSPLVPPILRMLAESNQNFLHPLIDLDPIDGTRVAD